VKLKEKKKKKREKDKAEKIFIIIPQAKIIYTVHYE